MSTDDLLQESVFPLGVALLPARISHPIIFKLAQQNRDLSLISVMQANTAKSALLVKVIARTPVFIHREAFFFLMLMRR